ncbi:P-loop containing nucleoside triphosphate hydrolases superfamily protein isoform 1 [Hibiscus syriacus]|uniref:P-loop containing nucleoside triphosphate hydrolases superfamily protein isoform 1 n=1 Tax=Hibiscus syriacus TaxID=106335 RepID=A0A6A2XRB1_HIBSY|nr:P-loop containing nucleoside triphosphate hydrolases superfamily protein isoform 1 [Hibiscus syriacus]
MLNMILLLFLIPGFFFVLRFLSKTSFLHILLNHFQSLEDRLHVYQSYRVPQFDHLFQENELYCKVSTYLNSLPSLEDSDFTNLFTGSKSNDIVLRLDIDQTIRDVSSEPESRGPSRNLKRMGPGQRKKEVKLCMNVDTPSAENGRWRLVQFNHPASFDTIVMDIDLKNRLKSDLETFLKSKQFYHRLGRVWKRSYLLHGPLGTGKSSFVAAMARFLNFDVYDIDLSKVKGDSDLKMLLLQTTNKSMIVVEDLDRFLMEKCRGVTLSGILNFMDGIISCCGEKRVMVFTMNKKDQVDEAVLRPGRIDVHVHFPLCDFSSFKNLANNYLGVKEHKLFPQLEEIFQGGASLTPAEIGEIMISNRSSPTRALKSVIMAMQNSGSTKSRRPSCDEEPVRNPEERVGIKGGCLVGIIRLEIFGNYMDF